MCNLAVGSPCALSRTGLHVHIFQVPFIVFEKYPKISSRPELESLNFSNSTTPVHLYPVIDFPWVHPKLRNTNLHNVTHSLISRTPRERMFVVQISLLIVTFLSLISRNLSLLQTTKVVDPHPRITPCVNIRVSPSSSSSSTCWVLVHASATSPRKIKWSRPH
jgi:hypothetical protein